jgi:hypothetical protein
LLRVETLTLQLKMVAARQERGLQPACIFLIVLAGWKVRLESPWQSRAQLLPVDAL